MVVIKSDSWNQDAVIKWGEPLIWEMRKDSVRHKLLYFLWDKFTGMEWKQWGGRDRQTEKEHP